MKVAVKILPREEVLDTQGRAVQESLVRGGAKLSSCRVGRYIVLEISSSSEEDAMKEAKKMTEEVLFNPLIETYTLERL